MIEVNLKYGQSFVDTVVEAAGIIDTLFESALASEISISDQPDSGTSVKVLKPAIENSDRITKVLPRSSAIKRVMQLDHQNIADLTIQQTGKMENLFAFCQENGIGITQITTPGTRYLVPEVEIEPETLAYYRDNRLTVSTGPIVDEPLFESGLFESGLFE